MNPFISETEIKGSLTYIAGSFRIINKEVQKIWINVLAVL